MVKNKGGRPAVERTGKRGRPTKSKTTKKAAAIAASNATGRTSKGKGRGKEVLAEESEDVYVYV